MGAQGKGWQKLKAKQRRGALGWESVKAAATGSGLAGAVMSFWNRVTGSGDEEKKR
jgi:hypothetical protein